MRSDPRNDRCAPFAKNRLVSGERTNRSYRVVPPRYPGTLFAASLLSLSSLSFENTRSTHTHTRCTVPDHPSTWLLFSNVTKGVVLRAILLLLYTARYILRSGVPEVSYLAKWLLVDALGPDSPLRLTSAFSPFLAGCTSSPPFIERARAPFRPFVTRFRQSDGLHPWIQICFYVYPFGVCRVSNGFAVIGSACWIGCSAGGSISVGESWRFRVSSTIRLEYRGPDWPTTGREQCRKLYSSLRSPRDLLFEN